jgi:hypothetical protein
MRLDRTTVLPVLRNLMYRYVNSVTLPQLFFYYYLMKSIRMLPYLYISVKVIKTNFFKNTVDFIFTEGSYLIFKEC